MPSPLSIHSIFGAEVNHKLYTIEFLNLIQNSDTSWQLDRTYHHKFCFRVKFYTKFLFPIFFGCAFVPMAANVVTSVICLMDEDVNDSIVCLLVANILYALWAFRATAMGMGGSLILYFVFIYMKFHFRQLNDVITDSISQSNVNLLIESTDKHQVLTSYVDRLNRLICFIFGFTYLTCTPPMNILFFIGFMVKGIHFLVKLICMSCAFQICFAIFFLNFTASSFTGMAHKPLKNLYSFMVKNYVSLLFRLKINQFIEKLGAHPIGFYCFDLFALNNYKFYQYISSFCSTYFLILQFISFYQQNE